MTTIFRRLRGVAATAISWAASWIILGAVFRVVWPLEPGGGFPSTQMLLSSALGWTVPGAIGGTVFALLVAGGGRQRIEDLTLRHAAIAGVLAGALLPFLAVTVGSVVSGTYVSGVFTQGLQHAIAGGLCGAGSLMLARRAAPTDPAEPSSAEHGVAPAT